MKRQPFEPSQAELEAERSLVGACLAYPELVLDAGVRSDELFDPRLQSAWAAILDLSGEGAPYDTVAVADRLEAMHRPVPPSELSELVAGSWSAGLVSDYVRIVRDGFITRQIMLAVDAVAVAQREGTGGGELLSLALAKLAAVSVEQPSETLGVRELLKARMSELAKIAEQKAKGEVAVTGIPTGLAGLDRLLGGLKRGICTVAAGRPAMGKSAFGLACTRHVTALGIGVHVFSLEDTREAYADRILSGESGVSAERISSAALEVRDLGQIVNAMNGVGPERRWLIDDRAGITAEEIVRCVRRSLAKNATQLVVVDYVQLVHGLPRQSPTEAVSHAMNVLADAAKQDNLAYLVLAQLNRDCERRDDKRPLLSDLKQSGAIEERAKCVIGLYRPAVYDEAADHDVVELLVRKNSNGQTGFAMARWHGDTIRMH